MAVGLNFGVGAQPAPTEYQVKAAFIYNFAKFVEWPPAAFARPDTPITIGVYGSNPFGHDLEAMVQDKSVDGRALVVRRITHPTDLRQCHIVFIAEGETRHLDRLLRELQGASVLTVGDADGFTQAGGMIDLFVQDNKVRFEINKAAAERAGLKISPRLLNLAEKRPR